MPHQYWEQAISMSDEDITTTNANLLRDCFSAELLKRISDSRDKPSKRSARSRKHHTSTSKAQLKQSNQLNSKNESNASAEAQQDISSPTEKPDGAASENLAEDLADFIAYLSTEIFDALPLPIQTLAHHNLQSSNLADTITDPSYPTTLLTHIPPSVTENLTTYALLPPSTSSTNLLTATLSAYLTAASAPPPPWSSTRASACEICDREWIPLTYHHLIPRSVHEKVLKRGWHEEHLLNSVAWLCRACHSYVHSLETNEVLAKEFYTVERLVEREDVRRWAAWVGRVRWKAR